MVSWQQGFLLLGAGLLSTGTYALYRHLHQASRRIETQLRKSLQSHRVILKLCSSDHDLVAHFLNYTEKAVSRIPLMAPRTLTLLPGEKKNLNLNLSLEVPEILGFQIRLGENHPQLKIQTSDYQLVFTHGTYRQVMIPLQNHGDEMVTLKMGAVAGYLYAGHLGKFQLEVLAD